jgi:molybdate transport system ATP-binding protein
MGGVAVEVTRQSGTLDVNIRKQLAGSGRPFTLEASFRADPGFTILFGASGAGKTTLLDCIAGLTAPDSGSVGLGERALFTDGNGLPAEGRGIGYVFQDLALFPHLNVEKNIQYGLHRLSAEKRSRRTREMLEAFRITHLAASGPDFRGRAPARGPGPGPGDRSVSAAAG